MSRPAARRRAANLRVVRFCVGLLAVVAFTAGCGARLGVEVTGSVRRTTGEAVTGGEVMIEPADGSAPAARTARTPIDAGRYRFTREEGVQPGDYVVRVIPATVLPGLGDQTGASLFTPTSKRVTVSAEAAGTVVDFTVEPLATFRP